MNEKTSRGILRSIGTKVVYALPVVALLVGLAATARSAQAAAICVDPSNTPTCHATITAALAAAVNGDTITVAAGTYPELFNITQNNLSLIGSGSVIVDVTTGSDAEEAAIYITGSDVLVQGLTVQGAVANTGFRYGIYAVNAPNLTLSTIVVNNMRRSGVNLHATADVTVTDVQSLNSNGAGFGLSDVKGADLTNITTAGNAWGGVGIFNFGRYFPIGNEDIVFAGTNSFGEFGRQERRPVSGVG